MIRRATIHDVYPLTLLFREYVTAVIDKDRKDLPGDIDHMAAILTSPAHFVVVAVERKRIVGYGHGMVYSGLDGEAVVAVVAVYVADKYRANGVGKALFESVLAFGRTRGATKAETTIPVEYNDTVIKHAGFERKTITYSMAIKGE